MVNSVQAKCPSNNMFSVEIAESRQSQSAWKLPSALATLNRKIYSSSSYGQRCWDFKTQHVGYICVSPKILIQHVGYPWIDKQMFNCSQILWPSFISKDWSDSGRIFCPERCTSFEGQDFSRLALACAELQRRMLMKRWMFVLSQN